MGTNSATKFSPRSQGWRSDRMGYCGGARLNIRIRQSSSAFPTTMILRMGRSASLRITARSPHLVRACTRKLAPRQPSLDLHLPQCAIQLLLHNLVILEHLFRVLERLGVVRVAQSGIAVLVAFVQDLMVHDV